MLRRRDRRKHPGRAAAMGGAVVFSSLAVGVGLTTARFRVTRGVALRARPVADQDRVVVVWARHDARGIEHLPFSLRAE